MHAISHLTYFDHVRVLCSLIFLRLYDHVEIHLSNFFKLFWFHLVAFMMGCHPRIATVSELTGIIPGEDTDRYLCSCGEKIKACNFWRAVSTQMQEIYKDFSYENFKTGYVPKSDSLIDRLQFSNLRSNILSDIRDYIYQKIPSILRLCWPYYKKKYRSCKYYIGFNKKRYIF